MGNTRIIPENAAANVPSLRKLGTGTTDAAAGDDARFAQSISQAELDAAIAAEAAIRTAADALKLAIANNLSDLNNVGTARTNLGLGTAATHPTTDFDAAGSAATEQSRAMAAEALAALKANNLSDLANAATARTNLGLGSAATHPSTDFDTAGAAAAEQTRAQAAEALKLAIANNLSDLANASTARTNLGLGSAATHPATDFDAAGAATAEQVRALAAEALLAPINNPTLTGTVQVPTPTAGDNSTKAATTAFIMSLIASYSVKDALSLADYGSVPDAEKYLDGVLPTSSNVIQLPSASLNSGHIGKQIGVEGAAIGYTARGRIASGSNQLIQTNVTIKVVAGSGTFPITFNGQTYTGTVTAGVIPSAATVQAGLEALSSIGVGNVDVTLLGATYTISLHAGASSTDTSLFSTSAASLVAAQNGPIAVSTLTTQTWWYGQVGLRVHIPGAGAAGAPLVGWVGAVEPVDSRIAYLYDQPPTREGVQGNPLNASTTVNGVVYNLLNAARGTITSIVDSTHAQVSFTNSAGALVDLTGLEVHLGTSNDTAVTNWLAACRSQKKPGYVPNGNYLLLAGKTSQAAQTGIVLYGAGEGSCFRHIPVDSEAESGRWTFGGTADSVAGRDNGVHIRFLRFEWPFAHTRGAGTVVGFPQNKTNAGGIFFYRVDNFTCHKITTINNYGVAITTPAARYGHISDCLSIDSWGNGIDIQNSNSTVGGLGTSDISVTNVRVFNSGDDMYAIDQYNVFGHIKRIQFTGCYGRGTRQYGLGRGLACNGGEDIVISGCEMHNASAASYDIQAAKATNAFNGWTVSTPGTGAQIVSATPQPNITAGVTQMRLFKNDGSGTTWIGDVSTVSGDGLTITLTATSAAGSATTCPFTGASSLVQWGANTDGFRWGVGGGKNYVISGCLGNGNNFNPSGDGTINGGFRARGGAASTEMVKNVIVNGLTLINNQEGGLLTNSIFTSTTSDVASADLLCQDVTMNNIHVVGTGFSGLTALRPWPGLYIQQGRNITLKTARISDTEDNAILIANSGISGMIRIEDVIGQDIGRAFTTGAPLAAAFDFGTASTFTAHAESLRLTNPSGTAGGTQYVSTNVLSRLSSGSTIRGVTSDIVGQALIVETGAGSRQYAIISPVVFRGQGTPEGVVTASIGAIYERSDGGAGAAIYIKESGTGNTGWIAYAAPGTGVPTPELDVLYGANPEMAAAAAALVVGSVYFVRLRGNGTLNNILLFPIATLTGNCQVGVYANTGSGFNATPTGSPITQSVSTAVAAGAGGAGGGLTANTRNSIALAVPQAVTHLNFWFALQVDSASTTWERIAGLGNLGLGFSRSQTGSYVAGTLPAASSPAANGALWPMMLGT